MSAPRRPRILLVDDEPMICESMAMLLNQAGYDVTPAADGEEALSEIERALPDVLVTDLRMPGMSGYALLAAMRRLYPTVPTIAMSGVYDFDDHFPEWLIADAFYSKGSHPPGRLLDMVGKLLNGASLTASANEQSAPAD